MYIREYETTLGEPFLSQSPSSFSLECQDLVKRRNAQEQSRVAVVGAGFAGLMAARWLGQSGFDVTVFEARNQVGGRVLSNSTWSKGRITEEGAELIGSFHTTWLKLAREYGLAMISRMNSELYEQARLNVRLRLGRDVSMDEFVQLEKAMRARVLEPLARDATRILDPSRPWLQLLLRAEDFRRVADVLKSPPYNVSPNEPLWKLLEFKLVNDEVAPLEQMNFLGLLCKVRAGQGMRFRFEDPQDKTTPLMRYWDELEIFRCGDGCQALATKMAEEFQSKEFQKKYGAKTKLYLSVAVTSIDLSQSKGQGVILGFRKVLDQPQERLAPSPAFSRYDYVILAVPPSVWSAMLVTPPAWHPKNEIGILGMNPAVKFFSDVKERFWIKRGLAPYGGSSEIGQVWEGTDNQTRTVSGKMPDPRGGALDVKQGIVLSVFAGPIKPGGRVPAPADFTGELTRLYPDYPRNLNKTHFSNWPLEPFIKTGYASPRPGEIFGIVQKLNDPFHSLLFFAGEHTRMDFFGYMEGALRSGERAAQLLMQHFCGLREKPAPAAPLRVATAGAAPIRANMVL